MNEIQCQLCIGGRALVRAAGTPKKSHWCSFGEPADPHACGNLYLALGARSPNGLLTFSLG